MNIYDKHLSWKSKSNIFHKKNLYYSSTAALWKQAEWVAVDWWRACRRGCPGRRRGRQPGCLKQRQRGELLGWALGGGWGSKAWGLQKQSYFFMTLMKHCYTHLCLMWILQLKLQKLDLWQKLSKCHPWNFEYYVFFLGDEDSVFSSLRREDVTSKCNLCIQFFIVFFFTLRLFLTPQKCRNF